MILTKNEKGIESLKSFDIISSLMHILTSSRELSHLALGCLGLLGRIKYFQA